MKRSMLALLILALPAAGWAQEKMKPPSGPPPLFATASARDRDGTVQLTLSFPTVVPKRVDRVVDRDGMKVTVTETVPEQVFQTRTLTVDGKEVYIAGLDGKKLSSKQVLERLETRGPLLLAPGRIDPYFQQFLRKDLLVLSGPAEKVFGAPPRPAPLPKPSPPAP